MRLLRESDFLEKNNLTVQVWNKFYIELIVLCVHRNTNIKQLLDEVFLISGIIKVEVSVIGWGW